MKIPILESDRLRLRAHHANDLHAAAEMWGDERTTRFIGAKPSTVSQTWLRILTYAGLWSHLGYGYWAIEEKSTGHFIGEVGFADFHRDMKPSIVGLPEMGWVITPDEHRKGFATEAITLALAWGKSNLPFPDALCIIDPANTTSIRLARKFKFGDASQVIYNGAATSLLRRKLNL